MLIIKNVKNFSLFSAFRFYCYTKLFCTIGGKKSPHDRIFFCFCSTQQKYYFMTWSLFEGWEEGGIPAYYSMFHITLIFIEAWRTTNTHFPLSLTLSADASVCYQFHQTYKFIHSLPSKKKSFSLIMHSTTASSYVFMMRKTIETRV